MLPLRFANSRDLQVFLLQRAGGAWLGAACGRGGAASTRLPCESSAVAWAQKLGRNLFFFLDVCRVKEIVVLCDKGGGSGMFEAS